MKCPLCNSTEVKKIYKEYPGYIEDTHYDIFECLKCDIQHIDTKKINPKIYDIIYSQENTPGYDRYLEYAKNIKSQTHPLKWLSEQESTYYPVHKLFKDKTTPYDILEIGCGYGYLTYALKKQGHNPIGIDISEKSIKFAKNNFGNYFQLSDINDLDKNKKFDWIIATEVIEHLENPIQFLKNCTAHLKKNGAILLTTPNKTYYTQQDIWKTDLPPVHTIWFSKKSFKLLGNALNLNCKFIDFSTYMPKKENILITYILSKLNSANIQKHVLNRDGSTYHERVKNSGTRIKKITKKIAFYRLVRILSNFCGMLIGAQKTTLGIIFIPNKD